MIWDMYPPCHKTISPSSTYVHVRHLAMAWVFVLGWFSIGGFFQFIIRSSTMYHFINSIYLRYINLCVGESKILSLILNVME